MIRGRYLRRKRGHGLKDATLKRHLPMQPLSKPPSLPATRMAKVFIVLALLLLLLSGLNLSSPPAAAATMTAKPRGSAHRGHKTTRASATYKLAVPLFRHRERPGVLTSETKLKAKRSLSSPHRSHALCGRNWSCNG